MLDNYYLILPVTNHSCICGRLNIRDLVKYPQWSCFDSLERPPITQCMCTHQQRGWQVGGKIPLSIGQGWVGSICHQQGHNLLEPASCRNVEWCITRKGGGVDVAAALQQEVDQDEVLGLHSVMEGGAATTRILAFTNNIIVTPSLPPSLPSLPRHGFPQFLCSNGNARQSPNWKIVSEAPKSQGEYGHWRANEALRMNPSPNPIALALALALALVPSPS